MCVHNRINKIGRAMLMVTAGLMAAGLLAAQLRAQSFELSQNGKKVGTANLSLKQDANGFNSTSDAKIDMPGLKYDFKEDEMLDPGYHLAKVDLKGSVNGTSATIDTAKQGQQLLMKIVANGNTTNTPLALHRNAVFLPDFDPGALQVLLNLGAADNNRDLWAVIPKQAGSIAAMRVVTDADMQGTLDGKQVTVHHLTVTYPSNKMEVFSGPSNDLLQAEWTDEGFALVRHGFKLTPPMRAPAPPPPPAQPAGQNGQPTPQGQAPVPQQQ